MATTATNNIPIYSDPRYVQKTDSSTVAATNAKKRNELGENDFMTLLIAQLKNQDPMNPMKDTDFVAQLAQFSALQQAQNTSKGVEQAAAAGLIGRMVSGSADTGIVTKVDIDDQGTHLTVNTVQKDSKGNVMFDKNGNPVYNYQLDKSGNPQLDANGNKIITTTQIDYKDIKEID